MFIKYFFCVRRCVRNFDVCLVLKIWLKIHVCHIIGMCECVYFKMPLNCHVLYMYILPYTVIIVKFKTEMIFMGMKHESSEERAVSVGLVWTDKALRRCLE